MNFKIFTHLLKIIFIFRSRLEKVSKNGFFLEFNRQEACTLEIILEQSGGGKKCKNKEMMSFSA